ARSLQGNVEDRDRFLAALRRASETTEDPRGTIKLDEYGNPTENVYIVRVDKVAGRLQNTVIHTYPMVSQFWTYKPDEFLKTPPYEFVRVDKVAGRLQNTVIHTYPMVSQFWTYKPDEFLKTPPYDRAYPPVKP